MHGTQAVKTIGEYAIGDIVGYIEKKQERQRELLSLRKWHVLQVRSQQETSVAEDIEMFGMAAYCPVEPRKRCIAPHRHKLAWRPMFSGYILVGFDPDGDLWHTIRGIENVIRLFMINFRPVPIPEFIMERIRDKEQELSLGRGIKQIPLPLKATDVVRATDGPFMGFFGVVIEVDQKNRRVRAELDIFGRKTPVEFEGDQLELV